MSGPVWETVVTLIAQTSLVKLEGFLMAALGQQQPLMSLAGERLLSANSGQSGILMLLPSIFSLRTVEGSKFFRQFVLMAHPSNAPTPCAVSSALGRLGLRKGSTPQFGQK
jgi:hypothetical protein